MENSEYVSKTKNLELEQNDALVNFNMATLFTNIPVDEAIFVAWKVLEVDEVFVDLPFLSVDAIMDLLGLCL